jgi:nitrite reductase/ring-hydroxylating ferredoxin subunit
MPVDTDSQQAQAPSQSQPRPSAPGGCPFHRWAEDFPIHWEADLYVTRRELTKFLTLGSGLLVGANVGIAVVGHTAHHGAFPAVRIAAASAIPARGSRLFRYPTDADPCILVRDESGDLHAYSQTCTHLSCAVVHRPEERALFCPCHHGYFSESEGLPLAGPPTRRLPRILLEIRGDEVFAIGVEV